MKPEINIEEITPAWAKKELAEQESRIEKGEYRQRVVNPATVARYANDMKQGHWMVNNQGIGFDDNGNLVDGRHRLWAVVRAGVPVKIMVMRGLTPIQNGSGQTVNPIDTIDCGKVRSVGNQLMIDGVKDPMVTASAIRAIGLLCCYPSKAKVGTIPTRGIINIYKDEIESCVAATIKDKVRSFVAAPIMMYANSSPRKAKQFLTDFREMVGLKEGSPVLALHRYVGLRGYGGTDSIRHGLCAVSLALFHYDQDNSINMIRHSEIGIDWLVKKQKDNVAKVRKLIGVDFE